jgi:hypothetical protein
MEIPARQPEWLWDSASRENSGSRDKPREQSRVLDDAESLAGRSSGHHSSLN